MPLDDYVSPEEIQRRIRAYRERLLAGRGPGASADETAPYMRDRQLLGGVPAAAVRQHEADQAALAADDPPAVDDVLIRHKTELAATRTALIMRLRSLRARAVAGLIVAAVGAVAALAAAAALRRPTDQESRSPQSRAPGASGHRASIGAWGSTIARHGHH